jgi:hypothetical protein
MAAIDKAALALTQCWKCAGCNRLEDESFRGDDKCRNYRKAVNDASTTKPNGESSGYTTKAGHMQG